jgi:hypothetical protein
MADSSADRADKLSDRYVLVDGAADMLTSNSTSSVGVAFFARPDRDERSVLRQLRERLDPWPDGIDDGSPTSGWRWGPRNALKLLYGSAIVPHSERSDRGWTPSPTHFLVPRSQDSSRGGRVRTRLTRMWAWQQVGRVAGGDHSLKYAMRPYSSESPISVWFRPWSYRTPQQLCAGLAAELLIGIAGRLSLPEQERLWFDLNLRHADASALRRRILASYLPQSLAGIIALVVIGAVVLLALARRSFVSPPALTVTDMTAIVGSIVGVVALVLQNRHRERGQASIGGVLGARFNDTVLSDTPPGTQPSEEALIKYLDQHDVPEVIRLATWYSPVVLLVEDVDRCSPDVLGTMVKALEVLQALGLGAFHFAVTMDPHIVAEQLDGFAATSNVETADNSKARTASQVGWRQLARLFDLWVPVPAVGFDDEDAYLDDLVETALSQFLPRGFMWPAHQMGHERPTEGPSSGGPDVEPSLWVTPTFVEDPREAEPSLADQLWAAVGSRAAVRQALRTSIRKTVERSPDLLNIFVALWRLYVLACVRTKPSPPPPSDFDELGAELARLAEIVVSWPWLLNRLSARADSPASGPIVLATLAEAATADGEWDRATQDAGLDLSDSGAAALRDVLRRPNTNSVLLVDLAARYL